MKCGNHWDTSITFLKIDLKMTQRSDSDPLRNWSYAKTALLTAVLALGKGQGGEQERHSVGANKDRIPIEFKITLKWWQHPPSDHKDALMHSLALSVHPLFSLDQ